MIKLLRRTFIFLIVSLLSLVLIVVLFVSPIAEYLIEHHSERYIGRKVRMDNLLINIFNGEVFFLNLKVYEPKSEKILFASKGLTVNATLYKIFRQQYEFTEVKLIEPYINIEQTDSIFNFDDLIALTRSDKKGKTNTSHKSAWFRIYNIQFLKGHLVYSNKSVGNTIHAYPLDIFCPIISHDTLNMDYLLSFGIGTGGKVTSKLSMNRNTLDFRMLTAIYQLNMKIAEPYAKDFMEQVRVDGSINTALDIRGNFRRAKELTARGDFHINNLNISNPQKDTVIAFRSLDLKVDSLNAAASYFNFKRMALIEPFFRFDVYDNGSNNITHLFGIETADKNTTIKSKVENTASTNVFYYIGKYVRTIAEQALKNYYHTDVMEIKQAHFNYRDFSMHEKFSIHMHHFDFYAGDVTSTNPDIKATMHAEINRQGRFRGELHVNPHNRRDFSLSLHIDSIQMPNFNPYVVYYTGYPFISGVLDYAASFDVKDQYLKNENDIVITNIHCGDKQPFARVKRVPVKLILAVVRDKHGNIELNVPVEGNLKDPNYKYWKALWKVLGRLLDKTATSPYRLLANAFKEKEEDYEVFYFDYLQEELNKDQEKQLHKIAKALKETPGLKASFVQYLSPGKEKELYILYEARRRFYLTQHKDIKELSKEDRRNILAIDIRDSLFTRYLNRNSDPKAMTVQDKCEQLVGDETAKAYVQKLSARRNQVLKAELVKDGVRPDKVKVMTNTVRKNYPADNRPVYKINYSDNRLP